MTSRLLIQEEYSRPANRDIFKAQRLHMRGREKVAPIEDQGAGHLSANALPIEPAKLIPFRQKKQGICSIRGDVRIGAVTKFREGGPCVGKCLRIECGDVRAGVR